ncbi:cytochrome c family protein [Myxococcota bacterium]|nr:cytochrome c family protein [Myxococcota bacterium]
MTRPVDRFAGALVVALSPLSGCGEDAPARGPLTAEERLDPAACGECHPDHYREWSGSMHAYAGEDPVFRAMNARGQRETDGALGDFCVRCHAPLAVERGLTKDGLNLDEVPPNLRGVTCIFCHSAVRAEGHANNPLVRVDDGVMRGGIADPVPNPAHGSVKSSLHDGASLQSSALCGPCHDIVTPGGLHLERTYAEWQASIYASDDPRFRNSCAACHMPGRDGPAADFEGVPLRRVHDHSMAAVDVALTDFPERAAQREKVQLALNGSVLAELCVVEVSGGADIEVYLENVGAGHAFPTGASQDRRIWLELSARAGDETLLEVGHFAPGEIIPDPADAPELWQFRDVMFDADGRVTHDFWRAVRLESNVLPAPNGVLPGEPGYINVHVPRRYRVIGPTPDLVETRLWLTPMGFDVLTDLVRSGDLDAAYLDAMPTFEIESVRLTWTRAAAESRISTFSDRPALCVGLNGQSRRQTPPGR